MTGGRVLDVGCGYGAESLCLAQAGFRVTGLDLSPEAIKYAKRKTGNQKRVKFIQGDILAVGEKLGAGSFDVIVDSSFLHGLKKSERERYLRMIQRLSTEKGWLFLFEFSSGDKYCQSFCPQTKWAFRRIPAGHGPKFYVRFFTQREIRDLLNSFKIVSHRIVKEKPSQDLIPLGIADRKFHVIYAAKK